MTKSAGKSTKCHQSCKILEIAALMNETLFILGGYAQQSKVGRADFLRRKESLREKLSKLYAEACKGE